MLRFGFPLLLLSLLLLLGVGTGAAGSSPGAAPSRTLVLLDDLKLLQTHSLWLEDLARAARQELFFAHIYNTPQLSLKKYGEYQYENLLLLCPSAQDFGDQISLEDVIEFMDSGRNIFVGVEGRVSDPIRDIGNECGIDFDPPGTVVQDHSQYFRGSSSSSSSSSSVSTASATADGMDGAAAASRGSRVETTDHSLVLLTPTQSSVLFQDFLPELRQQEVWSAEDRWKVLYRGIGHVRGEGTSRILEAFLQGQLTTYSDTPYSQQQAEAGRKTGKGGDDDDDDDVYPSGSAGLETLLVSGVQARNNARAVFAGSLDMCSNEFLLLHPDTEQRKFQKDFCLRIVEWAFGQRGLLRVKEIHHGLQSEEEEDAERMEKTELPERYRIKDDVRFTVVLEEWREQSWRPYLAPVEYPVQLEFTMVYPYLRLDLEQVDPVQRPGVYSVDFRIPDVYGVFKFSIQYHRPGYSNLEWEQTMPVRPFQHTEYERFIGAAYPYYLSVFSLMGAFLLFGLAFLYFKDPSSSSTSSPAAAAAAVMKTESTRSKKNK